MLKNQRGQSLIEYVILVALIGVGTMAMIGKLQKTVKLNVAHVIHTLQGQHATAPAHRKLQSVDLERTDFSNFMRGTRAHDGGEE